MASTGSRNLELVLRYGMFIVRYWPIAACQDSDLDDD